MKFVWVRWSSERKESDVERGSGVGLVGGIAERGKAVRKF